ncbi:MAG TPA: hypothetical protein VEB20_19745 [Azospirillaceae bacterium]|nr:hypothetical protein [Azospirillaceae bacterium]
MRMRLPAAALLAGADIAALPTRAETLQEGGAAPLISADVRFDAGGVKAAGQALR